MARKKWLKIQSVKTFENVVENPEPYKGKWKELFFRNDNEIILELACGKGEYTIALAGKFPAQNFIGVDIKGIRIWKGATIAREKQLANAAFLRYPIDRINEAFDQGEIAGLWITFPDPYIKKSKAEKRLVSPRFLNLYKQILKPGAIIQFKTDNAILFDYALEIMEKEKCEVLAMTKNLYSSNLADDITGISTTFEQKFLSQGIPIKYLKFRIN